MAQDMPPAPPEADAIRVARMAAKLTPDEAAAKVRNAGGKISASYWRDVERGHGGRRGLRVVTRASDERLAQMAQVVGVTPEQLAEAGRGDAATVLAAMDRRGPAVPSDLDLPPVLRGLDPREIEPFLVQVDRDLADGLTGERQPFDDFEQGILRNDQHTIDAKRVLIAIGRMYRAGILPGQSRTRSRSGLRHPRRPSMSRGGHEALTCRGKLLAYAIVTTHAQGALSHGTGGSRGQCRKLPLTMRPLGGVDHERGGMGSPGAAKLPPEPDPASVIAGYCAEASATLGQLREVLNMLSAGQCGRDTPLWLQDVGQHLWETRQQVAEASANLAAREDLIELGRQMGLDEAAARSRSRHARPQRSHLRLAGVAAAAAVVATSGTVATTMHDSANTSRTFLPSPAAVLHAAALPGDSATLIPQGSPVRSFSSPRPSTAVRTAKPVATPSPSPSSPVVTEAPPQPAPAPTQVAPPALQVSVSDLGLTGTTGSFTIAATTEIGVTWSAETDIPGATLSVTQGVLTSAQQPVTITLTDPLMESGVVYIKWGDQGISTIWVTPSAS